MDAQEIRTLLGKSIFERAQKYRKRILQSSCTTNEDGVRHLTALVQGSGPDCYYTQVWLRENGSFVSASCDCPYNQNGDGTYCKHIGALLLQDAEKNPPAPEKKPESIPGVQRGVAGLNPEPRKDSYSAGLDMLFGRKWRGEEPETDYEAQLLLKRYQREDAQPQPQNAAQRTGFALLEPELTPHNGRIWLRLRVSDGIGGRQYLVKSIPQFLDAIERGESVSYGKSLAFVHRWDAFAPDAQQLLRLLRRQVSARQAFEAEGTVRSGWEKGPAGGLPLTGEGLDALVELYAAEGVVGGYTLKEGLPVISLKVERRKGGVQLSCTPALSGVQGLDYAYLLGESTLWRMQREECRRVLPVLDTFGGRSLFFTSADAAAFCSYVLPELGNRVNIVDPDRLLLNQIPLEPVVQFYLDADRGLTVTAYPVFLYGEDRVAPGEPVPPDLLRDARTENRAKRLLETYLEPETGKPGHYSISGEEALFQLLEEGIPALLAMGEVYQTDAFRNLQAAPPKISVGVSVHGSVLDLEVDTGAFPVEELRELLQSLHQKKRYHRLRDGSLLRLDDSLEGLDELNDTLELSGAKLKDGHAALPLYRAPTLDWALSGQNGLRFDRDDAFRRISRSFHAVRDSEYTPPLSLQKTLRKYQRDGYRWLRTLDGYGMGGILADDMGLGKTVQVLSYLLAMKEGGQQLPSLIVCPASLVLNWQEECQKFTPQLQSVAMDGDAAHRGGQNAALDGFLPEGRADRAFFKHGHGRGKRASTQHDGKVLRLGGRETAGDAGLAAADAALDGGGAVHLAVKHDGHTLMDVLAGDALEHGRAARVEGKPDARLVVAVVEGGTGISHVLAGHERFLVQRDHAFRGGTVGTNRHHGEQGHTGRQNTLRVHVVAHEVERQLGGLAHKLDGALGIGQAGQLDLNAEIGLLADIRFGDAELVDTVADGADSLIKGHFLDLRFGGGRKGRRKTQPSAFYLCGRVNGKLRKIFGEQLLELGPLFGSGQQKFKAIVRGQARAQDGDPLFGSLSAQLLPGQRKGIAYGFVHFHAKGQVHPALQVKPEAYPRVRQQIAQRRSADARQARQHINDAGQQNQQRDDYPPTQRFHGVPLRASDSAHPPAPRPDLHCRYAYGPCFPR